MALEAPYIGRSGSLELDAALFDEPFHGALVHEAVRAERNARRSGTASTKTRAEVAMTGAKAWRQKGTGRARAGPLSAPQRVGGGVAFGPKPRGYTVKVNRKARRRALRAALTVHAERGSLAVLDPSGFDSPSTKRAAGALSGLGEPASTLVLLGPEGEEACQRSFRNIRNVNVLRAGDAGVLEIAGAARLVVSPAALEHLGALAARPSRHDGAATPRGTQSGKRAAS